MQGNALNLFITPTNNRPQYKVQVRGSQCSACPQCGDPTGGDKAQSKIEMSEEVMLKHVWKMKNEESPGPDNTCLRVLQGLRNKMIAYFH